MSGWEAARSTAGRTFCWASRFLATKFGLDWLVAQVIFDRPWTLYNYVALPGQALHVLALPDEDRIFFGTLLALALPFILIGVVLTVRRLRAAGLPDTLVVFFFIPVVNLFFFIILSVLPNRPEETGVAVDPELAELMGPERFARFRSTCRRITHGNRTPSAALALTVSVPLAVPGFVFLSVTLLHSYGWGLFVGLPFCLGLGTVLLYGAAQPQSFGSCIGVAMVAATLVGMFALVLAMEGFICLIMAAPIGYFLVFMGTLVGIQFTQAVEQSAQPDSHARLAPDVARQNQGKSGGRRPGTTADCSAIQH